MARPLPPDAQACDGAADRLARDVDGVPILQILPQQWGRPDRRMVAELARVGVDDPGDQGIDFAVAGSGATRARRVGEAPAQIKPRALLQSIGPVVDSLAGHQQGFRDLLDRSDALLIDERLYLVEGVWEAMNPNSTRR